jgi:hypothetical protein
MSMLHLVSVTTIAMKELQPGTAEKQLLRMHWCITSIDTMKLDTELANPAIGKTMG